MRTNAGDEHAEKMLAELAAYFGEPVMPITRYCQALRTWHVAIDAGAARGDKQLQHIAEAASVVRLAVAKSNLLARLLYDGEKWREKPCPVHLGRWSGCTWGDNECEHCMSGANVTGWCRL